MQTPFRGPIYLKPGEIVYGEARGLAAGFAPTPGLMPQTDARDLRISDLERRLADLERRFNERTPHAPA